MAILVAVMALAILAGTAVTTPAQVRPTPVLSGNEQMVPFNRRSSVLAIAERYRASPYTVRRLNSLDNRKRARATRLLFVSSRSIAPRPFQDGIVINLPAFRLFVLRKGQVTASWPVALGRDFDREWKNAKRWRTPVGTFKVKAKQWHPDWIVPKDLQKRLKNPREVVPFGDPEYPLGDAKVQLTASGITIHGTSSPRSIGRLASHGCIRMWNGAVKQLYKEINVGTPVALVYAPIQVVEADGRVWLEVNPDIYGMAGDMQERARIVLSGAGLLERADLEIVARTVQAAPGIAIDITRVTPGDAFEVARSATASATMSATASATTSATTGSPAPGQAILRDGPAP